MDKTVDSILRRVEERGYRLALVATSASLTIQAFHPGTGERFVVHGGWNGPLVAARELAAMVGVASEDLIGGFKARPFPLDDPEADEPQHRFSTMVR